MFDFEKLDSMLDRVRGLREPELVLLNGHLVIERMLTEIAAVRLRCTDSEVPRLGFRGILKLAFRADGRAKQVSLLNDLRNAVAHEFDALNTPRFASIVSEFGYDWPPGPLDRATVIELIVFEVQAVLMRQMINEIEVGWEPDLRDWDEKDHEELNDHAETVDELVSLARTFIEKGLWNQVVGILKPGWKRPSAG